MTRRALIGALAVTAAAGYAAYEHTSDAGAPLLDRASAGDWQAFVTRYVTSDGRVVDTGNGGITHSEGQGYGLLFAEHFGDRPMFDRLLDWTQRTLSRRGDALHSWRFLPDAPVKVTDPNNATDGDLMIAWALLRAGEHWSSRGYTALGTAIATDLLANCVREVGGATVLLPAIHGFEREGSVVLNPSYYIFPALATLATAVPDARWETLQIDGLRILRLARFGRWHLPSDWLEVARDSAGQVRPAPGWPARFSWDAVRVPLNLAWAGLTGEPAFAAAASFWGDPEHRRPPVWVDLNTDTLAADPASLGVRAVAEITRAARSGAPPPKLPHVADAENYYSASLVLLARVLWQERKAAAAV